MLTLSRISDRAWGWIAPIGVALLAFVLRVWNVGYPNKLVFDETYYAKDAWSLLQHGYVQDFADGANQRVIDGELDGILTGDPSWVVHPDGGKWVIALGEWLVGLDAFGWRISAVVVGSLTVLVLARLVRRLTGSTVIGCVAGLLLTLDGMHFVMSRLALLDVFLTFWIVCGVAALVADRDWIRVRLDRYRPLRPWQLAAGASFGMACATKWSGIYALAAFGLLIVIFEVLARLKGPDDQTVARHGWVRTTLTVGAPAFVSIVVVALIVYLLTWTGFLVHHEAYEARFGHGYGDYSDPWGNYIIQPSGGFGGGVLDALRSLWHFHVMTFDFHTQDLNEATHPYQSGPRGWLVLSRPVSADVVTDLPAASCGASPESSCMREILILGNPIIWWSGLLALFAAVVSWVVTRDWRWAVPVIGVAACWLPWFRFDDRPIFSFYAVTVLPFTIIAISLILHALIDAATTRATRITSRAVVAAYVLVIAAAFWYFHPIYTDDLISYDSWRSRMWFTRWI